MLTNEERRQIVLNNALEPFLNFYDSLTEMGFDCNSNIPITYFGKSITYQDLRNLVAAVRNEPV